MRYGCASQQQYENARRDGQREQDGVGATDVAAGQKRGDGQLPWERAWRQEPSAEQRDAWLRQLLEPCCFSPRGLPCARAVAAAQIIPC